MSDWPGATFINRMLHSRNAKVLGRDGHRLMLDIPGKGIYVLINDGHTYSEFLRLAKFLGVGKVEMYQITSY